MLSSALAASFAAFSASAANCLAFMAAFTAARRDLAAAALAPVGFAGAADGFCPNKKTVILCSCHGLTILNYFPELTDDFDSRNTYSIVWLG